MEGRDEKIESIKEMLDFLDDETVEKLSEITKIYYGSESCRKK